MNIKFLTVLIGLAFLFSCKDGNTGMDKAPRGIILANMDTTVSPKADFYHYVNGTWLKNTKIPDDRSSWGGFSVPRKSTDEDVMKIIARDKESGKYAPETDQAKALFIFNSKLDTTTRNALSITTLQPTLDAIADIGSIAELQTLLVKDPAVSSPFISIHAMADLNNSSMNATYIFGNGLGLPDRDYYLEQDSKSKEIRAEYVKHIA